MSGLAKPLSEHARDVLRSLKGGPRLRQEINAGVVWKLERDGFAEDTTLPSPYKKNKGQQIPAIKITEAGLKELAK